MSDDPAAKPEADRAYEQQLREMNEALLVSSVHQHELTEQAQKAEAALRESENRFRTLADSSPVLIWQTDNTGCVFVNRHYLSFFGQPFEAVAGMGWATFVHPDDLDAYLEVYRAAFNRREGYEFQCRLRRHDGEYRWSHTVGSPHRGPDGAFLGFIGYSADVTDMKRVEQALRESEAVLRFSMQAAGAGTWAWDVASGVVTWSAECYELFGIDAGTPLLYESWRGALHPDDRERADAAATWAMERREGLQVEYRINHPERGERWLTSIGRIIDPVNRPGFMTGISLDITDRRRLEKETQDQAAALSDQAAALSDLHRRKDEFLAMLSHELRNPLAPIANAVQLLRLQRGSENPIEQQARGIIERQVGQLKHLVDDLLEVSRITTGRIQLRRERIAVSGIVERAAEAAGPLIEQRRHELTLSQPPESIWLHADAARLEQVLVNLLTNAAKYTTEGGHIWLTVQPEGDTVVLRVRDTGIGIAPELLPRIFDLFTQSERSLDRSEGGLGIGLSLVQRLVELHGGTVKAFSVLGHGSEFVVCLPTTPLPASSESFTEATQPTESLRLLVVDDNVDTAEGLAMLLQVSGHDVRTAHDGPTALEAALDYRPDVVLLDIGLPGVSGFEVAKRIRQHPTLKNITLVAMTGYGQDTDRQRSREAGFDHHLIKPTDFGRVQEILSATILEKTNRSTDRDLS